MDSLRDRSSSSAAHPAATTKDAESLNLKDVQAAFGIDKHAKEGQDEAISAKRKRILIFACLCILGERAGVGGGALRCAGPRQKSQGPIWASTHAPRLLAGAAARARGGRD